MKKFGGILVAVLLLLTGCKAMLDPKVEADKACGSESLQVSSYNDAKYKDLEPTWDEIKSVENVKVSSAANEVPEGGAYEVFGTSQLTTNLDYTYSVDWRCFSQTVDGETYAAIVNWSIN